jgi:hypothetical protein
MGDLLHSTAATGSSAKALLARGYAWAQAAETLQKYSARMYALLPDRAAE